MNKKIIAVDFDDVVIMTNVPLLKHYNDTYGTNVQISDVYEHRIDAWGADYDTTAERVNRFHDLIQSENAEFVEGSIDAIKKLSELYELHIVTGRSSAIESSTQRIVDKYFPDLFVSIQYGNFFDIMHRSKADICKDIGAYMLIDDHKHHAEVVAAEGMDVLLFGNYPWNQSRDLPPNIRRVNDWGDVLRLLSPQDINV